MLFSVSFLSTIEFLHNSSYSAKYWQSPARIDILWVATIDCRYWQDPARMWQEINYAKTQIIPLKKLGFTGRIVSAIGSILPSFIYMLTCLTNLFDLQ